MYWTITEDAVWCDGGILICPCLWNFTNCWKTTFQARKVIYSTPALTIFCVEIQDT